MSARILTVGHALLLATCLSTAPAMAQVSTGSVRGIVRDNTGAVLPRVSVEAQSPSRLGTVTAVSDGQGMYRLENLPVGVYTVTLTLSGFSTVKHEGICIEVGRSIELDQDPKVSTLFGGPYDWPNYDTMQELQVESVGASAEQAVNLVLKSGSNTLEGSASYYGLVPGLFGNNTPGGVV